MANVCSVLNKSELKLLIKEIFISPSNKTFELLIKDLINNDYPNLSSEDISEFIKILEAFRKAPIIIKNSKNSVDNLSEYSLDRFVNIVNNTYNEINHKQEINSGEIQSKTEPLEGVENPDFKLSFMIDAYGFDSAAKYDMIKTFDQILSRLPISDYNKTINSAIEIINQDQLNMNFYNTLLNLWNDFLNEYKQINKSKEEEVNNLPSSLFKLNSRLRNELRDFFNQYNGDRINSLYFNEGPNNHLVKSFQLFFIIDHFDDLLVSRADNLFDVAERQHGLLRSPKNGKYQLKSQNKHLSTGWSSKEQEEQLSNPIEEANDLILVILNNLKLLNEKGEPIRNLNVQEIANNWTEIKEFGLKNVDFNKLPKDELKNILTEEDLEHFFIEEIIPDLNITTLSFRWKNLSELIADCDSDGLAIKILYTLLNNNDVLNLVNLNQIQKQIINSIYSQLFSLNGNSLYNAYLYNIKNRHGRNFNVKLKNYLQHINQFYLNLWHIPMTQYRIHDISDDGIITMGTNKIDSSVFVYQNQLLTKFSAEKDSNLLNNPEKFIEENNDDIQINEDVKINLTGLDAQSKNDKFLRIIIKRNDKSYISLIVKPTTKGLSINYFEHSSENSEIPTELNNIDELSNNDIFKLSIDNFIKEILMLNKFENFDSIINVYQSLGNSKTDLIEMSANILYNYAVSRKIQYVKTSDDYSISTLDDLKNLAKNYFFTVDNHYDFKIKKGNRLLYPYNKSLSPKFNNLIRTLNSIQGIFSEAIVKSFDGSMINTLSTNQLLARAWYQIVTNMKNPNYVAKSFDTFNNSYAGTELSREVSTKNGDKKFIQLTKAENAEFSFLYDFVNEFYNSGVIRIQPGILSDKVRVLKTKHNLNTLTKIKDESGNYKKLKDLSIDELYQLTKEEHGQYYKNIWDNINKQWNRVNELIKSSEFVNNYSDSDKKDLFDLLNLGFVFDHENGFIICNSVIDNFINQKRNEIINNPSVIQKYKNDYVLYLVKHEFETFEEAEQTANIYINGLNSLSNNPILKNINKSIESRVKKAIRNFINEAQIKENQLGNTLSIVENSFYIKDGIYFRPNYALIDMLYRFEQIDKNTAESLLPNNLLNTGHGNYLQFFRNKELQCLSDFLQFGVVLNAGKKKFGPIYNLGNVKHEENNSEWKVNGKIALGAFVVDDIDGIKIYNITDIKDLSENPIIKQLFWHAKHTRTEFKNYFSPLEWIRNPKFSFQTVEELAEEYFNEESKIITNEQNIYNDFENKKSEIINKYNEHVNVIQLRYFDNVNYWNERKQLSNSEAEIKRIDEKLLKLEREYNNKLESLKEQQNSSLNYNEEKLKTRLENLSKYSENPGFIKKLSIKVHPDLRKYNTFQYLLGQEYMNSTVGSFINHPGIKAVKDGLQAMESLMQSNQVKRNVSFSATLHQFMLNTLDGNPEEIYISHLQNETDEIYNLMGLTGEVINDDGAMYVNGVTQYLDNNSLYSDAVGLDKKHFIHDYFSQFGLGKIIKCAGFAVTNERILKSNFYRYLNYKSLKGIESEITPYLINGGLDITKNFFGDLINYGNSIKYQRNYIYDESGNLIDFGYQTYIINENGGYDKEDLNSINHHVFEVIPRSIKFNPNTGFIEYQSLDITDPNSVVQKRAVQIKNVYDIWMFFGGECALDDNFDVTKTPERKDFSEISFERTTFAVNSIGKITNKNLSNDKFIKNENRKFIQTQKDVNQYLKKSLIAYMPTVECTKQGADNLNSEKDFLNPNFSSSATKISLKNAGPQLNAEHESDNSNLSMMTQVLNALGARGFTAQEANETYQALLSLTNLALSDYLDSIDYSKTNQPAKARLSLEKFIAVMFGKTFNGKNNLTLSNNTFIDALLTQANLMISEKNNDYNFDDLKEVLPLDNITLLNKKITEIASIFTKNCVRIKFPGSMDVLSPSNGRILLFDDKMLSEYNGDLRELQKQDIINIENNLETIQLGEIKLGSTYYFKDVEGNLPKFGNKILNREDTVQFKVNTPLDYWMIKEWIKNHQTYIIPAKSIGRELAAYNVTFNIDGDNTTYNIWDIDEIKDMYQYDINLDKNSETYIQEHTQYIQKLLNVLNALSSKNISNNTFTINGKSVIINKNSINVSPYEIIMSLVYKSEFGLEKTDSVAEISNDELFFFKRQLKNYQSKLSDKEFDIELKKLDGNHSYIIFNDENNETNIPEGFNEINYKIITDNNELWFVDLRGDKKFKISSKEDKIYSNGQTIIFYTKNPEWFILNIKHNGGAFSTRIGDWSSEKIKLFFENKISKCEDVKWIKHFTEKFKAFNEQNENYEDNLSQNSLGSQFAEILSQIATVNDIKENNLKEFITKNRKEYLEELNKLLEFKSNEEIISYINSDSMKHSNFKHVLNNSLEIHTSFLKSLNILAARIPAQCMQSFMSMKIVGFDESGKNTAYVSRFLIYLQGSDFDIDKVSLLGFAFNNGHFVKWSHLMNSSNEELLTASENIPYPTGRKVNIVDNKQEISRLFDDLLINTSVEKSNDNLISELIINDKHILQIIEPDTIHQTNDEELDEDVNQLSDEEIKSKLDVLNISYLPEDDIREKLRNYYTFSKLRKSNTYTINLNSDNLSENELFIIKRFIQSRIPQNAIINSNSDLIKESFDQKITIAEDIYKYINDHMNDLFLLDEDGLIIINPNINNNVLGINLISKFIKEINRLGGIPEINTEVNDLNESNKRKNYNASLQNILNFIDEHNLYLTKHKNDTKKALINFIASKMFNITLDPVNQRQAMSSVDASDGAANKIKELSKNLDYSVKMKHVDAGATSTLYSVIDLTLGGRSSVGIVASSLKVFEGLSQYANNILNEGSQDQLKYILINKNIAGLTIQTIANLYQENKSNFLPKDIQETIDGLNQILDAYLNYSGIMSLATDNAKDPTLIKINGSEKMLGLYLAGVSLGIPIENLIKILTSNVALETSELMGDDLINGITGYKNISQIDSYIKFGPKNIFNNLSNDFKEKLTKEILPVYFDKTGETAPTFDKFGNYHLLKFIQSDERYFNNILNNLIEKSENPYQLNILKKQVQEWLNIKKLFEYSRVTLNVDGEEKSVNAWKEIKKLYYINSEMTRFNHVAKLNQSLPNKIGDLLAWIKKFESGIYERISEVTSYENNLKSVQDAKSRLSELNKKYNVKKNYNVDFFLFVEDENYRSEIIDIYNDLKYANNIYGAMTLSHYFGYIQSTAAEIKSVLNTSIIYKTLFDISQNVEINESETESAKRLNKAESWINSNLIDTFLLQYYNSSPGKEIKIKAGSKFYVGYNSSSLELKECKENTPIQLGTYSGNMTFKYIMENVVIPKFKSGEYKDLTLIKELNLISTNNTLDKNFIQQYATDSPTIAKSEFEEIKLSKYRHDLNYLKDKTIPELNNITFIDALFLYNLIVNGDKVSQTTLTNIFQESAINLGKKISELIESYYDFQKMDKEKIIQDLFINNPNLTDDYLQATALLDPLLTSNAEYVYLFNPYLNRNTLHKKEHKINNSEYDSETNFDFEENLNFDEENISDFEYADEEYEDVSKECKNYEILLENKGYKLVSTNVNNLIITAIPLNLVSSTKSSKELLDSIYDIENDKILIGNKYISFEEFKTQIERSDLANVKSWNEFLSAYNFIDKSGNATNEFTIEKLLDILENLNNCKN